MKYTRLRKSQPKPPTYMWVFVKGALTWVPATEYALLCQNYVPNKRWAGKSAYYAAGRAFGEFLKSKRK